MILLIDPDEESLFVVVEDTSAFGPVSVKTASVKEPVSFLEEEVIVNQLLLLCWSHGTKGIECASELTFEGVASLDYLLFDLISLLSSDSWSEWVSL